MQGASCSAVAAAAAVAAPALPLCLGKTAFVQLQAELFHILYILNQNSEVHDRVAAHVTSAVAEHHYAAAVAARSIAHLSSMGCVHWWAASFDFDEKTKHGGGVLSVSCMVCMCARV